MPKGMEAPGLQTQANQQTVMDFQDYEPNVTEVIRTNEDIDELGIIDVGSRVGHCFDSLGDAPLNLGRGLGTD